METKNKNLVNDFIKNEKYNMNEKISPILELYRGKVYANILKSFIYNCVNNLGTKIFSIKKSYPRTITNLLSSWFFTLYSDYDFSGDPFFPSNYENTNSLHTTLNDFVKYDETIEDKEEKINVILNTLKKDYKNALDNLNEYKQSSYYLEKKGNFEITKELIKQNRNDIEVYFYKFNITYPFKIRDKRQENIINNILIPQYIYEKLKVRFTGDIDNLDSYIWIIIYRYQLLGSNNNQLGVLPNVLFQMKNDFGLNYECFASAINSTFDSYCSIYYDIEKYFGSNGSFFNVEPISGTYGFNPPYQKEVMDKGILKILDNLEKANDNNKDLTFIITIPIWDKLGKKIMKYNHPEKVVKPIIEYDEFTSIKYIFASKFFKGKLMVSKDKFTYLDHNFHLFKNVTIQHTYILVLSTKDYNFQERLNTYSFQKK
tara:strand:+ start:98 stop:1384 length:1287 start_codon:yes stop_codon:yes gene_type:complete